MTLVKLSTNIVASAGMTTKRIVKKSMVITCHSCTFYRIRDKLVLCDSWSGHKNEQVLLEAFGGKDVDLNIINPPKSTKYAQSLDVYFFRQNKINLHMQKERYVSLHIIWGVWYSVNDRIGSEVLYKILVTGSLCTFECAGECRLSANLCKRALDVPAPLCTFECAGKCRLSANLCKHALDLTADVIVEATRNVRTFNKCLMQYVCSNANTLHSYVLRVPRKADWWGWVWSIFNIRTDWADHITCGTSICIVYWRKLRLGWLYV